MLDDGLVLRFRKYFTPATLHECWVWRGAKGVKGYGQIKRTGERRQVYAHRIAYELANGEVPEHKQVCHSCDNPLCVNPSHLFVGSSHDNHQDMKRKYRHLYGERNTEAILTEQQAREILALGSTVSQRELGRRYGVSQATISKIARGLRWKHLQKE